MSALRLLIPVAFVVLLPVTVADAIARQVSAPGPAIVVSADARPPLAGTLFLSPAERAQVEKSRRRGGGVEIPGSDDAPVLTGLMRRSDGQTTLWIDGAAHFGLGGDLVRRVGAGDVGNADGRILIKSAGPPKVIEYPPSPGKPRQTPRILSRPQ